MTKIADTSFNNKDTRTTPLISLILNIVNIVIINIEQLSHIIIVLKFLTLKRQFLAATNITKTLKIFFPFKFAITKICVAMRLAGDRTRMGGI